jgi:hypothetical protein
MFSNSFKAGAKLALIPLVAGLLAVAYCGHRTTTTEQTVEKHVDDSASHTGSTDTQVHNSTTTSEQHSQDEQRDVDVKKKFITKKTTIRKPDGTVVESETDTTTFEKQDKTKLHEDTGSTTVAQQDATQHTEEQTQTQHHEDTKTETRSTTTTSFGSRNALSLGFFINQDLRDSFRGKLNVTPGVSATLKLFGPTSVSAGIDLRGDVFAAGSVKAFSIYLHQDVSDLVKGDFRPKPGVGVDVTLLGPVGIGAGIDTSLNGYVGLTVRAF